MQSMGGTQHENIDHVLYERMAKAIKVIGEGDLMVGLQKLEREIKEIEQFKAEMEAEKVETLESESETETGEI